MEEQKKEENGKKNGKSVLVTEQDAEEEKDKGKTKSKIGPEDGGSVLEVGIRFIKFEARPSKSHNEYKESGTVQVDEGVNVKPPSRVNTEPM